MAGAVTLHLTEVDAKNLRSMLDDVRRRDRDPAWRNEASRLFEMVGTALHAATGSAEPV